MRALAILTLVFSLLPGMAVAADDAEAIYGKFHRALLSGNLDDMNRYGTPGGGEQLAKMPAAQRKQVLDMMKSLIPKRYKIVDRQLSSDGSRLRFRMTGTGSLFGGEGSMHEGAVLMLKQGGEWKVDDVKWDEAKQGAAPSLAPPAAAKKPAADSQPCVFGPAMSDEEIKRCR